MFSAKVGQSLTDIASLKSKSGATAEFLGTMEKMLDAGSSQPFGAQLESKPKAEEVSNSKPTKNRRDKKDKEGKDKEEKETVPAPAVLSPAEVEARIVQSMYSSPLEYIKTWQGAVSKYLGQVTTLIEQLGLQARIY
jgi:hypothetical protein